MVKVWKAVNTKIRIGLAAAFTATTTTSTLYELVGTPTQLEVKAENVTITEPEGAIDKLDLLGVEAMTLDTTKYAQSQEMDPKPYTTVTISGTLCEDEDEVLEAFFSAASKACTSGGSAYTRWMFGTTSRPQVAIVVQLIDGTAEVNIALDNAYITKTGDRRLDAADGHWQQDFEAKCLVKDYYVEYHN